MSPQTPTPHSQQSDTWTRAVPLTADMPRNPDTPKLQVGLREHRYTEGWGAAGPGPRSFMFPLNHTAAGDEHYPLLTSPRSLGWQ